MKRKKQGWDISSGDMASDADLLAERQRIWIGTSGWTYDSWRGPFYPPEVPKKDWLTWYGSNFPSTEINASFYRTPSLEAARDWRKRTPRNFRLCVEGVEVHHALETTERYLRKLDCIDGVEAEAPRAQGGTRPLSAAGKL